MRLEFKSLTCGELVRGFARLREYDAWTSDRVVIDTAGRDVNPCTRALFDALGVSMR